MDEKSSVTTGIKFKLNLDKEIANGLNNYFDEYGKAINFAVRIVDRELSKIKFAGKIKKNSNDEIIKDENGKKMYEYPDESCSCGKQIRYWENEKPLCEDCFKLKFTENGLRKRMYSAKGRKAEQDINIKNSTNKISKTHFNYAIREAFNQYKSIKRQKQERRKRLTNERKRLNQFIEMKDGNTITLPKKDRQRAHRFLHVSLKKEFEENPDKFRGYTISAIVGKIQALDRNIKREEKSLKEKGIINFKARKIMLDKSVKFIADNKVRLTISKNLPKEYDIELPKKEKRLSWLKERIGIIRNQTPKYSYLLRKEVNGNKTNPVYEYYLQYTLEIPLSIKKDYEGALGIDRGINHIAVCTFVSVTGKNGVPRFFSSGEILRLKHLQKERDRFLRSKHNKIRKKGNMRNIENQINLILHKYSKEIVKFAKDANAFIVFEELKKIKKGRIRMSKAQQYKLSLFIFKRLSELVSYKARRDGIRVTYVSPEYTSQFCSKCGSLDTQRPFNGNSSLFKCNKCDFQANADYNASINIAKKGLKSSSSTL